MATTAERHARRPRRHRRERNSARRRGPRWAEFRYLLGRALPFLVLAAAPLADVLTAPEERFDRFLIAAPALAAVTWGVRGTLAVGALAMGTTALLALGRGERLFPALLAGQAVLAVVTLAAALSSQARRRREAELRQVSEVAEAAQWAVLRPLPRRLGSVDLRLLYEASAAGAHVGGDFYKALKVRGGVRIMLGDVQGKGLAAVEAASLLLGSFREAAYTAPGLPAIAERLEASMARYAERAPESTAADRFATVLLAEIPDDEPVVRLLSCGHPAPVVQRGPAVRTVELSSPSVPIHLPVPVDAPFTVDEVPFAPGDRMLMFTDGVSETRDGHGAFYPLEQRLRGWAAEPADRIPGLLKEDLARYGAHGLDDDTTAVLVVRGGAGEETLPSQEEHLISA
ncbi:PP2C family protein-serine/threonine phosphatase [Streptomyces sp. WAC08241]|uniref:PP2C family protein-serine/threonine phosphatase n=1 Tax=Streptomyces sp. WAC08241 TaxID=2487421 RepID=UPI000F7AC2D6|nr:PP2C family protein-serine/threonine phosphatase [Streptomyces sp. WAC08241]RSS32830.1 serine/threonine-protein phosphatase [Streptomyces sp. WAC08241]